MRVNHPRSTRHHLPALTAATARRFARIAISGGERISSTERQLIEACVRALNDQSDATRSRPANPAVHSKSTATSANLLASAPQYQTHTKPDAIPNQSQSEPNFRLTEAIPPTEDHGRTSKTRNQSVASSLPMEFNSPVG
jgi:tRNA pseudouridine-54 N-methylase